MGNKKNKHNRDNVDLFNYLFSDFKAKIARNIQNLGVEGGNPNPEMSQNTHSNEDLLFANIEEAWKQSQIIMNSGIWKEPTPIYRSQVQLDMELLLIDILTCLNKVADGPTNTQLREELQALVKKIPNERSRAWEVIAGFLGVVASFLGAIALGVVCPPSLIITIPLIIFGEAFLIARIEGRGRLASEQEKASKPLKELLSDQQMFFKSSDAGVKKNEADQDRDDENDLELTRK